MRSINLDGAIILENPTPQEVQQVRQQLTTIFGREPQVEIKPLGLGMGHDKALFIMSYEYHTVGEFDGEFAQIATRDDGVQFVKPESGHWKWARFTLPCVFEQGASREAGEICKD